MVASFYRKNWFLTIFLTACTYICAFQQNYSSEPLYSHEIFPSFPSSPSRRPPSEIYRSPTDRYIEAYSWDAIANGLRGLQVTMAHRLFFDRITVREEIGFIGYHGSTQEYRVFQDIIRLILEEIVGLPSIRSDFHFFRIPGAPAYTYENLAAWGFPSYDSSRFLCMNFAIYGNHRNHFSSSYYYFFVNGSSKRVSYEKELQWLMSHLEIPLQEISPLFEIGRRHLGEEEGVLYQVFDMSHYDRKNNYYALADSQCLCYDTYETFSTAVLGKNASFFPNQIRMLMNTKYTLNPHSFLVINRYDKISEEKEKAYMEEMRQRIHALSYSPEKAWAYKTDLLETWGQK